MNTTELIDLVAHRTGLPKSEVASVVSATFTALAETVSRDEEVRVNRFGTFCTRTRAGHLGRNPATGEEMQIAEKRVLKLKLATDLKEQLNPGR